MRLKPQYLFVILIGVLVGLYFLVMTIVNPTPKSTAAAPKAETAADAVPGVQVQTAPEVVRQSYVVMRGRTEAARAVVVRSETPGVVAQAPAAEGSTVPAGAVLCRLSVDARQATLDQARANLRSRQLQQQAAADLAARGYRSQTQVLESRASLDAAQASVRSAEIALNQVNIRAPFAGVFDKRDAEVGTYLAPGQACGTMIELNPLLVVGDAPETEAAKLKVGAAATARLVSGQVITGRIRYVAHDADPQTRTYRVEITAANPGNAVRSGLSAEVRVGAGETPQHQIPVASMVLDAAGRQGVRFVQADGRVAFAPVKVVEETPQGVWVSGLSGEVRVIVVGQSYIAEGQKVSVVAAR
jgi:membrane fusion protein, multidrug efflux system